MSDTVNDFIGAFPNAVSKEYCEEVIKHFEWIQKIRGYKKGGILTRQQHEEVLTSKKESDMYYFEEEPDNAVLEKNAEILAEYNDATWRSYNKYKEKYGFLDSLPYHTMSHSVKMQRYKPSQGYHVWHCETCGGSSNRRMLVSVLYLNTVKEGGETEFLYQSKRVAPEQGTLVLFPSYWMYPHRGNPPLKGNKYIINSWLEFTE